MRGIILGALVGAFAMCDMNIGNAQQLSNATMNSSRAELQSDLQQDAWSRKGKFWLRVNVGPGYVQMSATDNVTGDVKISGIGGVGGVAFGAYLSDNVVLYGDLIANVLSGPTFEIGGSEITTTDAITVTAGGIGGGIGYYVAPNSFFIQASVAVSVMSFEARTATQTIEAETNPGIGFRIGIGKDWLISRKVALGFAGHGYLGIMKDKGTDAPTWTAFGVGVAFSFSWVPKGFRPPAD